MSNKTANYSGKNTTEKISPYIINTSDNFRSKIERVFSPIYQKKPYSSVNVTMVYCQSLKQTIYHTNMAGISKVSIQWRDTLSQLLNNTVLCYTVLACIFNRILTLSCSCINIATTLWLDASVLKKNGFIKSGNLNIELKSNLDFTRLNEFFIICCHRKNFRQYSIRQRKDLTGFFVSDLVASWMAFIF